LILSEYIPATEAMPWNFPQRNRIISALSDAVIVIEGDLQSGALITARFAIKQDKPLFALPGPIDSPASNGPNILIKSGVAELLTSVEDILEKIGESRQIKLDLENNDEKLNNLSEKEKHIYKLLSSVSKSFEILIEEVNIPVQELLKYLSMLELKGFVEKTQEGGYVKII
jgi:DNA processing protein